MKNLSKSILGGLGLIVAVAAMPVYAHWYTDEVRAGGSIKPQLDQRKIVGAGETAGIPTGGATNKDRDGLGADKKLIAGPYRYEAGAFGTDRTVIDARRTAVPPQEAASKARTIGDTYYGLPGDEARVTIPEPQNQMEQLGPEQCLLATGSCFKSNE